METQRLPLNRMRASDTERDLTIDHLAVAYSEGRLDSDEYERRVGAALIAIRVGELRALTGDLPVPVGAIPAPRFRAERVRDPRPEPAPRPPRLPWAEWGEEWRWWLTAGGLLTGLWGATSLLGGELILYWPLVPLGIWAAVLLASAIWPGEAEPPC
ncbi:DUF1707 domain-containing protein [Nocardiopsis sp. MG754419]|uniref:DUF1707 SHOCT-like domain-containing protein n=1 Tax=Nocardiopsis sp. MG754419 TaxID=2259865 RepID=UPI001BA572B8|nr:DUF1707 domain-containing protein [Nocardiopsis sp. MG754419]MBR8745068.1 hypothetical protein [Nocardiopsis sp. MG754419]